MDVRLSRLVGALVPVLGALLVWGPGMAESTSYLVSEMEQVTDGKPPCNEDRITTFKVKIRNDNGPLLFCTEDVNPLRRSGPIELGLESGDLLDALQSPPGSLKFLGFKRSAHDSCPDDCDSDFTKLGLEAGEDKEITVFFDVKTGPVTIPLLGLCDFEEAKFGVTVCDGGGGCDVGPWADPSDPKCEEPKAIHKKTLTADTSLCPASPDGTGVIRGLVTDGEDRRVGNARVTVTRGCRGSAGFVSKVDTTARFANRGEYEISGLPGPAVYTVEARDNGVCRTVSVTVGAGATVTQDLKLNSTCNN